MKQHTPVYVLSAALMVAAALLASALFFSPSAATAAAGSDPVRAYRLEQLNAVNDMVLRREVVPEDYLYYLSEDEALCTALAAYNEDTAVMYDYYSEYAVEVANFLFYEHSESPGDYNQPMLYYEWTGRIPHLALYRNANLLCQTDPFLSYPLAKESGGSYGIWAWRMHISDPTRAALTEEYFQQIDALLLQLEDYRQTFS